MKSSLIRRACVAAVVLAATMAPAVAAQTDDTGARGGTAAPSDIGAKARLLGERTIPNKFTYRGTTVGGLSGIDRDPCTGEYVAISDDRSVLQPARFYTVRIAVDATGVHSVDFTGTHPLLQPGGAVYPALHAGDGKAVDPEEVRVDPQNCDYWWAQEGERPKSSDGLVIQPSIQFADRSGAYRGQLTLPPNYEILAGDRGLRRNKAVEAITFGARGSMLTSAVEGPLLQDGPEPTLQHGAPVRVTQQSRDGAVLAVRLPARKDLRRARRVQHLSARHRCARDPGLPRRLQPLPRHRAHLGVRRGLQDPSLRRHHPRRHRRAAHRLPQGTKDRPDAQEARRGPGGLRSVRGLQHRGMAWGPTLADGERSLVLVSDDNFTEDAATQIVALGIR